MTIPADADNVLTTISGDLIYGFSILLAFLSGPDCEDHAETNDLIKLQKEKKKHIGRIQGHR